MYAVEKKYDIEMKLKKEMTNVSELKAAASRSSTIANDVCNVLGACEHRLQQLESAVLPLYGDTAKLQHIHHNMERTVKALDHVINYYMLAQQLADLIHLGPYTATTDSLNSYLEALDKLVEAQNYFNKNNPQSVELENIKQLYNTGVTKLEGTFEDLLARDTRPLSPSTIVDMITLEEETSAESVSGAASAVSSAASEALREAAVWLSAAGRPPAAALRSVRTPAVNTSVNGFRDYLRTRTLGSHQMKAAKGILNRTDSTKRPSKLQKVANKLMKATQTIENSTGLAIGSRRYTMNDSFTEETMPELVEEEETVVELAACVCLLARNEQRYMLGLVPLAGLPPLLHQVMAGAIATLTADIERACAKWRKMASRCSAGAAGCWAAAARLNTLSKDLERALASPNSKITIAASIIDSCVRTCEEWVEGVRGDGSPAPADGTVHQLAVSALAYLQALPEHVAIIGQALANEPSGAYSRAASQVLGVQDREGLMLAIYMRKVLAQVNLALRNKSEQYPDALKAIFLLNNTLYLSQGLQSSGLMDILMLAEPDCAVHYRDMMKEHKNAYIQSWNKLISHTVLEETFPNKLRDKDRQTIKDKFSAFNRELEESGSRQRLYSVPEPELRESLKRGAKDALLPHYSAFYDAAAPLPFSKNPHKYIKYTPVQVVSLLDSFFDETA